MAHRIIPRAEWGARRPDGFGDRSLGHLDKVLHHSVTQAPDLLPPFDDDFAAIRSLEEIGHRRFNGGISYTFPITPAGLIFEGHSVGRVGSHTAGRNSTSAGIVLVGNYENDYVTSEQLAALAWLLNEGVERGYWRLRTITWGHRDLKATACPGRNAYKLIPVINGGGVVPIDNPITPPKPAPPKPAPPKPAPPVKPPRNIKQSVATQQAVRIPADGFWGQDTDNGVNAIRGALNNNFPMGVKFAQLRVGAKADGIWGPLSKAALGRTVRALQAAWGTGADGIWGAQTEAAWVAARARNFNNWT